MNKPVSKSRLRGFVLFLILAVLSFAENVQATPDLRFDVVTFCCNCSGSILCQPQFNNLNFPTTNGHYLAMGSDQYRYELAANGNALAIYYNDLDDNYPGFAAAQQAASIDSNSVINFTSTGPKPNWIVLNEISTSLWETNSNYRTWVEEVVHALAATYGYNVIVYSPFANPAANSSDWQAVSADACIAVENYLSGQEIAGENFSVSWCQSQYQSSINSYAALGVPAGRLILGEHYGQTVSGTGYGRSGVTSNQWDMAINARSTAAEECAFAGDVGYDWGNDNLNVSTNEMIHFEDTYAANALPVTALTAPYVLVQPQSQTLPTGSAATFLVFQAGAASTTYQWRFLGTNVPGATTSSLTVANVQVTNAGNYSVVLSNSAGTAVSADAYLTVGISPPIGYEPFAYTPGANLVGQTNIIGGYWTQAGPNGTQPIIQAGNLAVGGLAGPSGNSVIFGGNGMSARFNSSPATNSTTGTWYYSFAMRLADISTLNSSGVFWVGFNNSSGTQTTTPTSVGTRVVTRSATGGYNIGLDKSSGTVADFVFSSSVFTTNDTVFLVASYTFNTTIGTDDLSQLWINPAPSTFGVAGAPPPTLSNSAGTDLSGIDSLVLFNRSANEPASIIADEVRIGTSWSSVTPPSELQPPPTLNLSRLGNYSILSWATNAPGFLLESEPALANPGSWSVVNAPVYIISGQYLVTNTTSAGKTFYRLAEP